MLDLPGDTAAAERDACRAHFARSLEAAVAQDEPYRHWILQDVLPADMAAAMDALPFPAPALNGLSGSREIHNNTRRYIDAEAIGKHPMCAALAQAFQHPDTVAVVEEATGAQLDGCCLRIEYAQDTDGFWLQPHTDLGVKKLTMLYYLPEAGQETLGTDIYADKDTWTKRAPFAANAALVFVPSDNTWHGFEPRTISGVRKSVILNYVTDEWRAREQLAYGDEPVRL